MGDEGKAAGCVPLAALLSLNFSLFVLAITSQNIDLQSDARASGITRPMDHRPPYGQKTQTAASALPSSGLLFWSEKRSPQSAAPRLSYIALPVTAWIAS